MRELFLIITVLGIGLALIWSIKVLAVYIMAYQQIGPTCGFYALIYGVSKVQPIKKKKITRKIITDFINSEESYVGEIFDIDKMLDIVRRYFPEVKAKILCIHGVADLDQQLKNNYVVYPCNHDGIPHYCFLEANEGSEYLCRETIFLRKFKIDKQELYLKNCNLSELPEFVWSDYFDREKKVLTIKEKVSLILQVISDCVLYRRLQNVQRKRKDMLYDKRTKVNMCGKILVIPKNQSL